MAWYSTLSVSGCWKRNVSALSYDLLVAKWDPVQPRDGDADQGWPTNRPNGLDASPPCLANATDRDSV